MNNQCEILDYVRTYIRTSSACYSRLERLNVVTRITTKDKLMRQL